VLQGHPPEECVAGAVNGTAVERRQPTATGPEIGHFAEFESVGIAMSSSFFVSEKTFRAEKPNLQCIHP